MASELAAQDYIRVLLEGEAQGAQYDTCDVSKVVLQLPPWYDEEKFKRGQRYMLNNLLGQLMLMLSGLVSILTVPSLLTFLINLRKAISAEGVYKQFIHTMMQVYSWFFYELKPGTVLWKSLHGVRTRHIKSWKASLLRGDGGISQRDLAITQFSFFGIGLLKPHLLGLDHDNREDLEGYVHFWRTIGYMLGIHDRYNICRPSLDETKEVCQFMCDEVFQKLMYNPPEYFYHSMSDLLDGMWFVNAIISTNPFIYFTYQMFGVPGFNRPLQVKDAQMLPETEDKIKITFDRNLNHDLFKNINESNDNVLNPELFYCTFNWLERFILKLYAYVLRSKFSFLVRLFYNGAMRLNLIILHYFPYIGLWMFKLRSCVDMFAAEKKFALPGKLRTNKEVLDTLYNKT